MAAKQRDPANGSGRVTSDAGEIGVRRSVGPGTIRVVLERDLMVEQTEAGLPGSLTAPRRMPRRLPPSKPAAAGSLAEPAVTAPWLLLLIIGCLLIPGNFALGGIQLSPNRLLLLALLPFLAWRWLQRRGGTPERRRHPHAAQHRLALAVAGGEPRARLRCRGASSSRVEIFGGYLVGRMLIRNTADYRRFFVLLTLGFVGLLPFAVVEMLTGQEPDPAALRRHLHHSAAAGEPRDAPRHGPGADGLRASDPVRDHRLDGGGEHALHLPRQVPAVGAALAPSSSSWCSPRSPRGRCSRSACSWR